MRNDNLEAENRSFRQHLPSIFCYIFSSSVTLQVGDEPHELQEGMLRDTARNEPYRLALERCLQRLPGATVMERLHGPWLCII